MGGVSIESSLVESEGVGLTVPDGELPDSRCCFAARYGLSVARAGVEDQPPEPPVSARSPRLFGQDGEVAQGEVAVDALVDRLNREPPPRQAGQDG